MRKAPNLGLVEKQQLSVIPGDESILSLNRPCKFIISHTHVKAENVLNAGMLCTRFHMLNYLSKTMKFAT